MEHFQFYLILDDLKMQQPKLLNFVSHLSSQ